MRSVARRSRASRDGTTPEGHPKQAPGSGSPRDPRSVRRLLQRPSASTPPKGINRASRAGMTFGTVDPEARFEEILGINRSAETRQGLPMHPHYLDEANVRRYFERSTDVFGVTDADGVLKATSPSGAMARSRAGAHSRPRRRSQVGSDVSARHRDDSGTCGAEAAPGLSEMVRVRHQARPADAFAVACLLLRSRRYDHARDHRQWGSSPTCHWPGM